MKVNTNHAVYKEHDAACSQPQLILMIYDGAIRYTKEAAEHMQAKRWAEKGIAIDSAFACIAELRRALNMRDGGDVAESLDKMYDFLCTKLTIGNLEKDIDQFNQIVKCLEVLRGAWQDAFDQMKRDGQFAESKLPETYAVSVP
jgi:flagellar secretion chaperone FliS